MPIVKGQRQKVVSPKYPENAPYKGHATKDRGIAADFPGTKDTAIPQQTLSPLERNPNSIFETGKYRLNVRKMDDRVKSRKA